MIPGFMRHMKLFLLFFSWFWILALHLLFRLCNGHSHSGAQFDQVYFELDEGGNDVLRHISLLGWGHILLIGQYILRKMRPKLP